MTGAFFAWRGLWYFRKSYCGVLAGAALGAMVLLGALLAGDSVKATLRQVAAARLGKVDAVLVGGDRMFRAALADDLTAAEVQSAPVMMLRATVTVQRNGRALGNVQVLGVDQRFWQLGPGSDTMTPPQDHAFFVNEHLARSLDLEKNETLVLRFDKPALIARDAPLAGKDTDLIALRGEVGKICDDAGFGRFSLEATQLPQATVWVPLKRLQEAIGFAGKANLMLLRDLRQRDQAGMLEVIRDRCVLTDYGLSVVDVPLAKATEVRTARIFFDRRVAAAIQERFPAAQPVITYMANTIAANGKETPYSMVTALGPEAAPFLPKDLHGVVLNAWEAEDLGAVTGDEVRIDYYALAAGNRLVERGVRLPVAAVVPLSGLAADPRWMPDYPGVAEAENAADWDAGVPLDLKRLRDKDEKYWDAHRGTPKLFLPLATGRAMFGNRWGEFTALRVPTAVAPREAVAAGLLEVLTPAVAGLVLQDFRGQGLAAAASPVDFAGLFLGMSLLLMAAAVALTALLFRFHIEQRNRESGLLAALGIPANKILRWRLLEGCVVVVAGSGVGALLAAGYTRWLLGFLETIWSSAGGRRTFRFHVEPMTMLTGVAGFVLLLMLVIWLVTRRQGRRSASLRLEAGTEEVARTPARRLPWWAAGYVFGGVVAVAGSGLLGVPAAFFLAGIAFLLAGLEFYRWVLRRRVAAVTGELSLRRLVELNCARRPARSLVAVGTLACGVFLVVSVAAFRQHGGDEWQQRASGTGGFAFWVETTRAVNRSNNRGDVVEDVAGLGEARSRFGEIVPLRVGPGDDASCFNLNQVSRPRLLATDVSALAKRQSFTIKEVIVGGRKDWDILREGEVMRAFVDETTLRWVLKKKLGERLVYQDEWGQPMLVELAGTLDGTVFQGSLVVDEARFLEHYPSAAGPRVFMLESGSEREACRVLLQQKLADQGAMVATTSERLAAFHGVENTYIAIFHVLGGLGVIVGSAGLGLVTARNLTERRYEFAVLHTIGVPGTVTSRIVRNETGQFIGWGLGIGLVASLVAIIPSIARGGILQSLAWIGLLLLLIAANAWFWSWLGYRRQIRSALSAQQEFV